MPNKNIREVAGKPLLAWTIEQALEAKLDEYVVSTDSTQIAEVAREYGATVIMRPDELATDTATSIDALIHALDVTEMLAGQPEFDIVADIRNTNPTKLAYDIDGAIRKLIATGADCVCGVTKLEDHHPSRIKMIVEDRLVDVWPEPEGGNRQDLTPDCYIRNGSIYAVRTTALREGIFFLGGVTRPWVMPIERSVNIDNEMDLMICDALLTAAK